MWILSCQPGRNRLVDTRFLRIWISRRRTILTDAFFTWSLVSLIGLGIFHGLNPGMGWLFAVAIGMQDRSMKSVIIALGPIAIGHALAIGVVVLTVGLLGTFIPSVPLLILSGLVLLGFGLYKVATRFRHPKWVGMRVSKAELVLWSFIMATAHGAGLMLIPVMLRLRGEAVPSAVAEGHHAHHAPAAMEPMGIVIATVGIHTIAMIATALVLALVVYSLVGVDVLRKAWINLDWIWTGAVIITGAITLVFGLMQLTTA